MWNQTIFTLATILNINKVQINQTSFKNICIISTMMIKTIYFYLYNLYSFCLNKCFKLFKKSPLAFVKIVCFQMSHKMFCMQIYSTTWATSWLKKVWRNIRAVYFIMEFLKNCFFSTKNWPYKSSFWIVCVLFWFHIQLWDK